MFQPHLYSRTKQFLDQFAGSFTDADKVTLLPIYAAREKPDPEVSSRLLSEKIQAAGTDVDLVADMDEAVELLKKTVSEDTLILTQGAGDIYKVADTLVEGSVSEVKS